MVEKAIKDKELIYYGDINSRREYIHVEDAARASVDALGDSFCNESVVLTGQEPMRVLDLLKMLAEILGYDNDIEFLETTQAGHYVRTPYSYQPKIGRKFIAPMHVDLGQGLIQLITEIDNGG